MSQVARHVIIERGHCHATAAAAHVIMPHVIMTGAPKPTRRYAGRKMKERSRCVMISGEVCRECSIQVGSMRLCPIGSAQDAFISEYLTAPSGFVA
eukprot:3394690-Rhodomonas_salina.1